MKGVVKVKKRKKVKKLEKRLANDATRSTIRKVGALIAVSARRRESSACFIFLSSALRACIMRFHFVQNMMVEMPLRLTTVKSAVACRYLILRPMCNLVIRDTFILCNA